MFFCKNTKNNNYNTPINGWKDILQFIDKSDKLWLPFYNDGKAKEYLNDLSFNNVIHINKDFIIINDEK